MVPRHAHALATKPLSAACQRQYRWTTTMQQCWAASFGVCFIYVFFRHVFLFCLFLHFAFGVASLCVASRRDPSRCATAEWAIGGTRDGLTRKTLGSIKIVNNRKTIIKPNCASIEASCVYRSVETSRRRRINTPNTQYKMAKLLLLVVGIAALGAAQAHAATTPQQQQKLQQLISEEQSKCASGQDSMACIKERAMRFVDNVLSKDSYTVSSRSPFKSA